MNDCGYMRLAAELAERGVGWTSPNPLVGAVIVKDGRIIGQGWHARCGGLHAEREALRACTEDPAGATLYVTLEPCCHTGRQPPCIAPQPPKRQPPKKSLHFRRNCKIAGETFS